MAFASLVDTTETTYASLLSSFSVDMPASTVSGRLLVCLAAIQTPGNAPSGWTRKGYQSHPTLGGLGIYAKVADGTEGGTSVNFVNSDGSSFGAFQVQQYSDWYGGLDGLELSAFSTQNDTTAPNTPTITASWGTLDNKFVSVFAHWNLFGGASTVSAYPTNYTGGNEANAFGSNSVCAVANSYRDLAAATDDPGVATVSNTDDIISVTLVIRTTTIPTGATGTVSSNLPRMIAQATGTGVPRNVRSSAVIT